MVLFCPSSNFLYRSQITKLPLTPCRYKSLTASIERGIQYSRPPRSKNRDSFAPKGHAPLRKSAYLEYEHGGLGRQSSLRDSQSRLRRTARRVENGTPRGAKKEEGESGDAEKFGTLGIERPRNRFSYSFRENAEHQEEVDERHHREDRRQPSVPESLPYTTAASEFLYGFSVVQAAIKANRRKLYNLYIHSRGMENAGVEGILARARETRVKIHKVGDEYLRVLDKASNGRPHNGFVLESSPLRKPPVTKLKDASRLKAYFRVELDKQSREDLVINGEKTEYPYKAAGWRHPLVLYVDGVLDEGNLGAIARSAYFLGVDAIATPSRQSAPWSHIALKASAGGAEAVPIFTVNKPSDFLAESARLGWRIYASDALPPEQRLTDVTSPPTSQNAGQDWSSNVIFTFARSTRRVPPGHSPVEEHPTILMMGAEGTGLRSSLLNHAHYKVGIRAGRQTNEIGVDSLNVSVAASLLCFEMLKKPTRSVRTGSLLF